MKHKIEWDEKCKPCNGTGLYIGIAEDDGAAVVCYICNGTGCHHRKFEYDDFTGREIRPIVTRVFEINCGVGIGLLPSLNLKLEDFGGMDYTDWLEGKPFPPKSEMRRFTCPCWWYQTVSYDKKPRWKECNLGTYFPSCEYFPNKEKCWERWDEEYGV